MKKNYEKSVEEVIKEARHIFDVAHGRVGIAYDKAADNVFVYGYEEFNQYATDEGYEFEEWDWIPCADMPDDVLAKVPHMEPFTLSDYLAGQVYGLRYENCEPIPDAAKRFGWPSYEAAHAEHRQEVSSNA